MSKKSGNLYGLMNDWKALLFVTVDCRCSTTVGRDDLSRALKLESLGTDGQTILAHYLRHTESKKRYDSRQENKQLTEDIDDGIQYMNTKHKTCHKLHSLLLIDISHRVFLIFYCTSRA